MLRNQTKGCCEKKVWNSNIVTTNFSFRWKTDLAKVQFMVFYTVYFILFELTSTEDLHQLTFERTYNL